MKKLLRMALCTGLMAALLCIPSLALHSPLPEAPQGDFHVVVNGQPITFTDAVPQLKDGRSCLPFVAVFQQLGFAEEDMTWDSESQSVTAVKGGTAIALTIGKNEIVLTKDGQSTTHTTDVAPYVSGGRTYIPFGVVADLLGYKVGWDAAVRAVIIDDVDAIMASSTASYELMDKYMEYSKSLTQGSVKMDGSYTGSIAMFMQQGDQSMDLQYLLDGDFDLLMADDTAMQFDTQAALDYTALMNGIDMTQLLDSTGEVPLPMEFKMAMRGDMKEGILYYSIPMEGMEDTWFKLDMGAMYDQMSQLTGMDYRQLMELSYACLDMSFQESLAAILELFPVTSVELTTKDMLDLYEQLLADSSFTKSGSTYVNNFVEVDGFSGTFTITTSGGKVNGYAVEMTGRDPELGLDLQMSVGMQGREMYAEFAFATSAEEEEGSMSVGIGLSMGGTYRPTTAKPQTAPPAGQEIVDLSAPMGVIGGADGPTSILTAD